MDDLTYGREPSIAVFADSASGQKRLESWANAAGARIICRHAITEGNAMLEHLAADAALVDVSDDAGADLDRLLHRLDQLAETERMRSVVSITPDLIDVVTARLTHSGVTMLCRGSDLDGVAALTLALAPLPALLFEERGDDLSMQLRRVREEVGRIARVLATVAGSDERIAPPALPDEPKPAIAEEPGTALLRQLIRARRLRERFFDPELFADPAWDMLLDLMLARMEGRAVAVSSLCIAAAVPPTTALRWIKRLTDEGLFVRTADPLDGRRVFIDLSEAASIAMMRYLRLNLSNAYSHSNGD